MNGPGFPMSDAWMTACGNQMGSQFLAAQEIARRWGVSRSDMDELAVESHRERHGLRQRGDSSARSFRWR